MRIVTSILRVAALSVMIWASSILLTDSTLQACGVSCTQAGTNFSYCECGSSQIIADDNYTVYWDCVWSPQAGMYIPTNVRAGSPWYCSPCTDC